MRYFVLGPSGERYGPVDLPTLAQWVQEGRVLATHTIEVEGTGQRMMASFIPGLTFAPGNPPPTSWPQPGIPSSPATFPMTGSTGGEGQRDLNIAYICAGISIALTLGLPMCLPFGNVILAAIGIGAAYRARGTFHPSANQAVGFAWVALLFAALKTLGFLSFLPF